ncbi:MAG: hypothetical protein HZA91_07295 [Verrucomicrobia bacterium]|nr:hypothetical protein [Verrucomicrobiota bacterium]
MLATNNLMMRHSIMNYFRVLFLALLVAFTPALAETRNESSHLKLSTDAASGRAALLDKRNGVAWDLGAVADAALSKDGRSVVIRRTAASNDAIRLLDGALEIAAGESGCALVPAREGLLIPADSGVEFSRSFSTSGYEGCHMNMMGFIKRGAALLMTWDDAYIRPELVKTKQSLKCSVHARRPPHCESAAFAITLTPLGRGDWNTIASAYRKIAEAKGLAVTLAAKARRNPETAKLFGASNAKLWTCLARRRSEDSTRDESVEVKWTFDEAAQVAEHLKRDLGMDRCLFTLGGWTEGGYDCRHPDALPANPECGGNDALAAAVARIKALGYVACFHDNYQDMYRDAKSWNPDYIQKKPDGSLMSGGRWLGGRAWLVCAPKTLELAQRPQNLPAVQKLFGPQAYFIDTTYAVGPQECFDPKHPLTYNDDIRWKQKLSDYSRKVFGIFGSECGREWAIPHSEFFEGLSGVSGRYFHNLDPATLGATVVPLFEMVYHDCEVVFGKYGYAPEAAAEYVAHHALCGRTLNYHRLDSHLYWKQPVPEVKARPGVVSVSQVSSSKLQIRYRWQVEADGAGDWRVLVHFGKEQPPPFLNDHAPARPVAGWRAGDVIEEGPFEVAVPPTVKADAVDVYMGLCRGPRGAERARLPDSGADGRVLVGRLRLKPAIVFEKVEGRPAIGDRGCFVRADNGWADGLCAMDRFVKNTHEILGPLAAITAHARLTKLEFLTPDRAVRRATFGGSGGRPAATVTVNFGASEFVAESPLGGKVTLPTWGFLIESPRFVAFHATSWAGRSYNAPVLFTARMDDKHTRIFHGFGEARLTWRGRELEVRREMEMK